MYKRQDDDNGKLIAQAQVWRRPDAGAWMPVGAVQNASLTNPRVANVTVTAFSDWTVSDIDSPLPVELTSFTAAREGASVLLRWSTATETNNYGFDVQRSGDARTWSTLAFIEGAGTSSAPKQYQYRDTPYYDGQPAGTLWYRLRQVDRDGSATFSKPVLLTAASPASAALLEVFPNPVTSSSTAAISYTLPEAGNADVRLYDALGRVAATLPQGWQTQGAHALHLPVAGLAPGAYLLQLSVNGIPLRAQGVRVQR